MLYDQYCHAPDQKAESRNCVSSNNIMKTERHTCVLNTDDLPVGESIEEIAESVDELREKLANMKKLMIERKGTTLGEISARKRKETSNMIDGNLLSWIFGLALMGILIVSSYAFYNLYHAVLKRFPSHHTEL
ncbi:hypothetical protein ALC60_03908 [Trachymyrmex zeteki]|uniref:Uncharacterized protein n=2 Tax=Mycetomoellerius zeteki TaxID=64791 RepID=A0A151X9R0_9HYME|nr:PREDICTED: uncharacterized protein LOC108721130 isoform X2 [Trachymyrmex zeteki]XP_018301007.1 PREDICTED: uncharacterized protein LOC108721130 isoform X2 [Trachymyrmex zeteki]XP_018301008.1 PREDICTED: uncharacterized protein LOC108721130 isoform X2 [Trachymyrmex zeteki]KYQ57102.1 hypothetical protein ALC60_03908 [Trachymyrmex zeteki]